MDPKHRLNLYLHKAINDFEDGNFDDAEYILLQARNICNDDRVASLLKQVQDAKASLVTETPTVDVEMVEDNARNVTKDFTEPLCQKPETMAEKETRMVRNMFQMRVRILSMQIVVASDRILTHKRYTSIVDNTKETEKYRNKATKALCCGNFDETNDTLCKAEKLYSEMSAILFPVRESKETSSERVRKKKPVTASNSHVLTDGVNKEEVVGCLKKAEAAFSGGDLKIAEKWLLKSLRMCPTLNAQEMLSKVQKAISDAEEAAKPDPNTDSNTEQNDDHSEQTIEQIGDNNMIEADKCLEAAKNALAEEKFDLSERLFLKAQRMNRTLDVDNYLKEIRAAKASRSSSDGSRRENLSNNTQRPSVELNKDEAKIYLEIAQNALRNDNIERAEEFLSKSNECFPTKQAKDLQKKIDAVKSSLNSKKSEPKAGSSSSCLIADTWREKFRPNSNNVLDEMSEELPRNEKAEMYLTVALDALNEGEIEKAEIFVQQSWNSCPTQHAREVQQKIDDAKYNRRVTRASAAKRHCRSEDNEEIYEKYLKIAEDEIERGSIEKAEYNALEAKRLCPQYNTRIEKLLSEIQAKRSQENNNSKPTCPVHIKDISKKETNKSARVSLRSDHQSNHENNRKVAELLEAATNASDSGNLIHAEQLLQELYNLQPNEYNAGLLMKVQEKLPKISQNDESHSKNEGADHQTKNSTSATPIHLKRAQEAFDKGDIINAESLVNIAEDVESCPSSRELYIKILKAKYKIPERKNTKQKINKNVNAFKENEYLNMAENAYIQANYKEAVDLIVKSNQSSQYVRELQKKFASSKARNANILTKLKNGVMNMLPKF